jgi:hypothetical protein
MKVTFCLLVVFWGSVSSLIGQNWLSIGHFNGSATHFAVDDQNDILFIAGEFNTINDTTFVQGVCKYDGQQITSILSAADLNSFEDDFFKINAIAFFNGELYVSSADIGAFGSIEGVPVQGKTFKFNGDNWESVFTDFAICNGMRVINDKLFLLGSTGVFFNGSQFLNHFIGVYDGTEFNTHLYNVPNPITGLNSDFGFVNDIIAIDSGYVILANVQHFTSSNEYIGLSTDIYFWDGISDFTYYNDGLISTVADDYIFALNPLVAQIYQDELYVGGVISPIAASNVQSSGIVVKGDNNWVSISEDGGNMGGGVGKMLIHNNELWLVGGFTSWTPNSGPVLQLSKIAIWDGTEMHRPTDDIFQSLGTSGGTVIHDIIVFQDTVYIAGNFVGISAEYITSVAKFSMQDIETSVSNNSVDAAFALHPNPSTHTVFLTSPDLASGSFVHIYNLSGQLVYEQNVLEQSERLAIATAQIGPPGMYVVQLHHPGKAMAVQKLVVAE